MKVRKNKSKETTMDKKDIPNNKFLKKFPEQIIHLSVVFAVFIVGIILIRAYAVPARLKESGYHRTKTIDSELLIKGSYSESEVCAECHDDINDRKRSGFHKFLACETCHGAGAVHAEDPGETSPPAPTGRVYCALCHAYDPARPTGFPQVTTMAHNPMKACISCHDPHAPKPPEAPKECSACHGEISRTKSISPHVQLECVTCHVVPKNHKTTPQAEKPTKPEKREFCGKCHARDAKVKGTPGVDMKTHGEKYLCWQCHYPHMPEVR
jgi:hypothetical protein